MGLFDVWKKRKKNKNRSVIKTEDKDKMEVGKKVATTTKSAIQKRREAEAELLKDL